MFLRHMTRLPEGMDPADTFEYVDEHTGEVSASAILQKTECPMLFPDRPLQVYIEFEGAPVPDSLLGAAITRGRLLMMQRGISARLYTRCAVDDNELIEQLSAFGFDAEDGLVRMRRHTGEGIRRVMPNGYTIVRDALMDVMEQKLFLDRYNKIYGTRHGHDWLMQYIDSDHFQRIIALGPTGIAGEITVWIGENVGVIGHIHTAKQYRHQGIASALITLACDYFEQCGLYCAEVNLRDGIPHIVPLLSTLGFTKTGTLIRYPGMDYEPGKDDEF